VVFPGQPLSPPADAAGAGRWRPATTLTPVEGRRAARPPATVPRPAPGLGLAPGPAASRPVPRVVNTCD